MQEFSWTVDNTHIGNICKLVCHCMAMQFFIFCNFSAVANGSSTLPGFHATTYTFFLISVCPIPLHVRQHCALCQVAWIHTIFVLDLLGILFIRQNYAAIMCYTIAAHHTTIRDLPCYSDWLLVCHSTCQLCVIILLESWHPVATLVTL